MTEKLGKGFVIMLLILGAVAFSAPFYVMLTMALKSPDEIARTSVWSWPEHVTLENFRLVLTNPYAVFTLFTKNSTILAVVGTIGVVGSSSAVAYAFARIDFMGRDRLFIVLLSTMMLPGIVTMIPSYVIYAQIGWVNTFRPLTVPAFFGGGAYNIFLLRQFYMTLPRELDEAAIIDGATHWTIFSRLILPLSGPALATVGIFCFIGSWRDLMGPLLYLNDPAKQTLELGLRTYQTMHNEQWHLLMAGSVLISVPLIILFFAGQRYFVKGIALSGLK